MLLLRVLNRVSNCFGDRYSGIFCLQSLSYHVFPQFVCGVCTSATITMSCDLEKWKQRHHYRFTFLYLKFEMKNDTNMSLQNKRFFY